MEGYERGLSLPQTKYGTKWLSNHQIDACTMGRFERKYRKRVRVWRKCLRSHLLIRVTARFIKLFRTYAIVGPLP